MFDKFSLNQCRQLLAAIVLTAVFLVYLLGSVFDLRRIPPFRLVAVPLEETHEGGLFIDLPPDPSLETYHVLLENNEHVQPFDMLYVASYHEAHFFLPGEPFPFGRTVRASSPNEAVAKLLRDEAPPPTPERKEDAGHLRVSFSR